MENKELANAKIYCVYLILDIVDGKQYAGQTCCTMSRRMNQHFRDAERGKSDCPLAQAIRKYGRENFRVCCFREGLTKAEVNKEETFLIDAFDLRNRDFGYNVSKGGSGFGKRKKRDVPLQKLVSLYESGLSTTEVGDRTGLDNSTVGYWLSRLGVKIRKAAPPKIDVSDEEILRLYRTGLSSTKVGEKLGIAGGTVLFRLKTMKEPARSQRKTTKISPEQMWVLYQEGKTLEEIGNLSGISALTVKSRMKEVGGKPRALGSWCKRNDLCPDKIVKLYLEGLNSRQIAEQLGCGETTIWTKLEKSGINFRPRGTRSSKTMIQSTERNENDDMGTI